MFRKYILTLMALILFIFFDNIIIICTNYKTKNKYISYFFYLKKEILFYSSKYKYCNISKSPLQCGHNYEGYKVQQKGFHPKNAIVNLSIYKYIRTYKELNCKSKEIIIGVVSAPHHSMERLSLRMGYNDYQFLSLLFFSGLTVNYTANDQLYKENEVFNDIIIFNFTSHYFNSSLMLILEINWIYTNCRNFKYFIYHTPDVYFNFHLFYILYINTSNSYPYIAQILNKNRVLRTNKSRFYVPFDVYRKKYYPPQPNGPLIAIYNSTIKKIVKNLNKVNYSFWMDDVYLAFLFDFIHLKGYNIKNAISLYPIQIKSLPNISTILNSIIYIHSLPPGAIYYLLDLTNNYYSKIYQIH